MKRNFSSLFSRLVSKSVATTTAIVLSVCTVQAAPANNLIWNGTGTNNTWVTGGSATPWLNGTTPDKFQNGDNVTFQFKDNLNTSITVSGTLTPGTVTITSSYSFTGGTINASGAVNISGGTTTLNSTLSSSSTTGIQVNNGGTLLLGASNLIGTSTAQTNITLSGGTFKTGGFSEGNASTAGLGTLTLTETSILDFSSTTESLHFTSLSSFPSNTSLKIYNWDGTNQLFFDNASTLTSTQLSQIIFYSDAGNTQIGTAGGGLGGSMTPVPEPSTIIAGIGLVGFLGWRERRRIGALLKRDRDAGELAAA